MTTTPVADRITDAHRETFARNHAWNREHYGANPAEYRDLTRTGRRRAPQEGVEPIALHVGEQVRFLNSRRWMLVRAVSDRHAVLTCTQEFTERALSYTIISWPQGRRGPHSSYGPWGIDTDDQCAAIVAAMDAADPERGAGTGQLELSERRAIRLDIDTIRRPRTLLHYRHDDGREGVVYGRLIDGDRGPIWEIRDPRDWWVFSGGWTRTGLAALSTDRMAPAEAVAATTS